MTLIVIMIMIMIMIIIIMMMMMMIMIMIMVMGAGNRPFMTASSCDVKCLRWNERGRDLRSPPPLGGLPALGGKGPKVPAPLVPTKAFEIT